MQLRRAPILLTLLVGCARPAPPTASPTSAPVATDRWAHAPDAWPRFRDALAGAWHGTTADGAAVDVVFRPIAGASALAETFGRPERATMTLYHPDHAGLVATHYCAQGNQPRLRATAIAPDQLRFAEDATTDLDPDEARLVELTFTLGADRFERVEDYLAPDGTHERTTWRFVRAAAAAE